MKAVEDTLGLLATRLARFLVGIVGGIVLARWLGPHDRGALALVLLLPSTVVTLVKFGTAQANVYTINRGKGSLDAVASNALCLAIFWGLVSSSVVWLWRDHLTGTLLSGVPDWALVFALIRVPILLLDNYLFSILQATGNFATYNSRRVVAELLWLALITIGLVVLDLGLAGALVIYGVAWVLHVVWLFVAMSREIRFRPTIDWPLLRETYSFGVRSYLQILTQHMLLRNSSYMVSYFLGPANVAFYTIAVRLSELILVLPQAMGVVLYPKLASLEKGEVHRLTAETCRRSLLITLPAAGALAWLGPQLIVLWYGDAFQPAVAPLRWAALGVVLMSIYVILSRDFTSRAEQRINTLSGLVALAVNVLLNLLLIPKWGIVGAAVAIAFAYAFACALLLGAFLYESRLPLREVLVPTGDDARFFSSVSAQLWHRLIASLWRR